MEVKPIGIIHSPFNKPDGMPIQPVFAKDSEGIVEIYEPYRQGLKDLEGFERIWLLYWFHKARDPRLIVKPYIDNTERGLFATRAPARPNPIGISSVRLLSIEAGSIRVAELDILDGTPLLDVKPYISKFDCYKVKRNGWIDNVPDKQGIADKRFCNQNRTGD
jgi:tRNA-Thr(GGU) m(6)t(6)A37 methyltransferase TsaA